LLNAEEEKKMDPTAGQGSRKRRVVESVPINTNFIRNVPSLAHDTGRTGFDEEAPTGGFDIMADPFEVRVRFTSQLHNLNASVASAQKAAQYALKYKDMCEDLHSCILEQLERVCWPCR
jgi:CTD kinase subunit gamma CTK3